MNADKSKATSLICVHLRAAITSSLLVCATLVCALLVGAISVSGCSKPSAANVALRKENQDLRAKLDELERARLSDAARIRALEQHSGTIPTLPQERLDKLFTTQSVVIGRLSGGAKINAASDSLGDDAIKVYLSPRDQAGDAIKAAGSVVIEAFDLGESENPRIGRWEFSKQQLEKNFVNALLMYDFVLTCPLASPPKHDQITVRAAFTDELTQRTFEAQRVVKITLGPTTAPVTER